MALTLTADWFTSTNQPKVNGRIWLVQTLRVPYLIRDIPDEIYQTRYIRRDIPDEIYQTRYRDIPDEIYHISSHSWIHFQFIHSLSTISLVDRIEKRKKISQFEVKWKYYFNHDLSFYCGLFLNTVGPLLKEANIPSLFFTLWP